MLINMYGLLPSVLLSQYAFAGFTSISVPLISLRIQQTGSNQSIWLLFMFVMKQDFTTQALEIIRINSLANTLFKDYFILQ